MRTPSPANHLVLNSYRLDSYNKMFVEIREILGTKKYMNQESVINAVSKTKAEERWQRQEGRKERLQGPDHDQVCWRMLGVAGDQAINNRTAGTIRTRSRKPRLQRSLTYGEVRALRDQGSQAIGVAQAQG